MLKYGISAVGHEREEVFLNFFFFVGYISYSSVIGNASTAVGNTCRTWISWIFQAALSIRKNAYLSLDIHNLIFQPIWENCHSTYKFIPNTNERITVLKCYYGYADMVEGISFNFRKQMHLMLSRHGPVLVFLSMVGIYPPSLGMWSSSLVGTS